MAKYTNDVRWSETRARLFRTCRYRYWLNHYLAWEGYLPNAAPEKKQAYLLKKMFPIPMWLGILVHEVIETAIQSFRDKGVMPVLAEMQDDALARFEKQWNDSLKGSWKTNTKLVRLFEHHYGLPASKSVKDTCKVKVMRCLDNFHHHSIAALIATRKPDDFVSHEEMLVFPLKGGEQVTVKMDLAFNAGALLCIPDWKTGKPNAEIANQLTVYAMYAMKQWKRPLNQIRAMPIYLDQFDSTTVDALGEKHRVTMEMVMRQAEVIRTEFAQLKQADAQQNDRSQFQPTANAKACRDCPFKEMCPGAGSKV